MVQSHYTAPMVQTAFRSTAFKGSCASPVHSHLGNDTVINCYGAQALSANSAGGFTPTMTDASTAANCAAALGSISPCSWCVLRDFTFGNLQMRAQTPLANDQILPGRSILLGLTRSAAGSTATHR